MSLNECCLRDFLSLVHTLTGITIGMDRGSMVEGRLRRRLRTLSIERFEDYLQLVKSSSQEQQVFIDQITTNKTLCFRTPGVWSYLEKDFIPEWHDRNSGRTFKAWSAAASSGEEALSIAVICEEFRKRHPNFSYQILGTDISESIISDCKNAFYSKNAAESFQKARPDYFDEYLTPTADGRYRASKQLRARMRFQKHNLLDSLSTGEKFHLVLLRNVLIYFQKDEQQIVLAKIHPHVFEDGRLIIGESESISNLCCSYQKIQNLVYAPCNVGADALHCTKPI